MGINFITDDCIDIDSTISSLLSNTTGTFSAWTKMPDATPADENRLLVFGDTDANTHIAFYIATTGILICTFRQSGTNQWVLATDASAVSDDVWSHVAITQDGISPVLYVDGIAVAQTFIVSSDKTKWFNDTTGIDKGRIGCANWNNNGNTQFFNGAITEVTIWDIALTGAEIEAIYLPKIKGIVLGFQPNNIVAYYSIDDGTDGSSADGVTIRDSVNGNDGTGDNGANNTGLIFKAEEVLSYIPSVTFINIAVSIFTKTQTLEFNNISQVLNFNNVPKTLEFNNVPKTLEFSLKRS